MVEKLSFELNTTTPESLFDNIVIFERFCRSPWIQLAKSAFSNHIETIGKLW
jgi:hypothetical protein